MEFCLDPTSQPSESWAVSGLEKDPEKRHRHDVGVISHGAKTQEQVTRAIQYILAFCVICSMILVVYAFTA